MGLRSLRRAACLKYSQDVATLMATHLEVLRNTRTLRDISVFRAQTKTMPTFAVITPHLALSL